MAESRRVQHTTLSCTVPLSWDNVFSAPKSSLRHVPDSTSAETPTVRLFLTLFEPGERHFPEFSYNQLVENQVIGHQADCLLRGLLEEQESENNEFVSIAQQIEEKYNDQPKKTDRIQDLIDIGYGYDEEDSFIDNSEPYDEFVPASITTKFGGFYVNSGVLQFRQGSDTEIDELLIAEKSHALKKKRRLVQNDVQDKPKQKHCKPSGEMLSKMNTQLSDGHNKITLKKKSKTLSVTSMLKKFKREKEKEREKVEKNHRSVHSLVCGTTVPSFPADAAGGGGLASVDPLLCLIGSTNDHALIQAASTTDLDIDLDSLLDATEVNFCSKSLPQSMSETKLIQCLADEQNGMTDHCTTAVHNSKALTEPHPAQSQLLSNECTTSLSSHKYASMPEGLSPGLEKSIRKLMLAAKTSEGESKLKFFTPSINSIILESYNRRATGCVWKAVQLCQSLLDPIFWPISLSSIELQCRELGGHLRSKVYTHLSSFLPCSRDTLLKRARKLALAKMDPVGEEHHIQKLKEAIGRAMPEQITHFQKSCQEYEQMKSSKTVDDDSAEDRGGKRGGPRKLFKWNDEIRECLGNVLRKKMEDKKEQSQEMEDNIKALLDEIKPLWPKGWMQSRILFRESRKVLGFTASLQVGNVKSEKKRVLQKHESSELESCNTQKSTPIVTLDNCREISHNPLISTSLSADIEMKQDEFKGLETGLAISMQSNFLAQASAVLTLSNLSTEQKEAQHSLHSIPQAILAASVAEYSYSDEMRFDAEAKSPPFPPPPPQSSPVGFPITPAASSQLLPTRNPKYLDSSAVYIISDE